jgi:tRNA pseudouridine32 synthase / 23S rRNA pseudouridine746 synthase
MVPAAPPPPPLRNPFEPAEPHPLARVAAEILQEEIPRLPVAQREDAAGGKMFGVLIARDAAGNVSTARAFAGMLGGRWDVDGFVGPVFDLALRSATWPAAERELRELDASLVHARDDEATAIKRHRAARSNQFLETLLEGYQLRNARGEVRSVSELFAPDVPPGGAGDCAGPKLFAHAQRAGLRPVALAEFWWGATSATGAQRHGGYYPSCRRKCGPVLTHMLQGWDVDALTIPGGEPIPRDEPRTLYEDQWLVVVDKPAGLLSVPGRHGATRDCALARLRARHPDATGPMIVDRLDVDTSGVMLVAKDVSTYLDLRRQLTMRQADKRYVAIVGGAVPGDEGAIELPVHGKGALTTWTVLQRQADRTRLALRSPTGRPHQLRVHAAHPLGLNAPIVGDRLYGTEDARLLLHADLIRFVNPHRGVTLEVASPAPF